MTEITLDPSTLAQMQGAKDYLRLRGLDGRVVGYFVPADRTAAEVLFGVKSPEERLRRSQETVGKPLSEFWADMRQQYPDKFK